MNRVRLLLVLASLGPGICACGYTPKQLGITGPGTGQTPVASHASETDLDAIVAEPGLPVGFGDPYATSNSPGEDQPHRFFGYN